MKKVYFFFLLFTAHDLIAQNRLPVFKIPKSVKPDIEKVVSDYYGHFYSLKGDKIDETAQTIEYKSKLVPQGALESKITQLKNQVNVYSWQAVMLTTIEFEKAAEKYKELFHQLQGSIFIAYAGKQFKLKGEYDSPDDSRSFASSILSPDVENKAARRLKIEVAINYLLPDWSVKILVYEKDADEDIRPTENYDAGLWKVPDAKVSK